VLAFGAMRVSVAGCRETRTLSNWEPATERGDGPQFAGKQVLGLSLSQQAAADGAASREIGDSTSLVKAGPTPAFLLARIFAAHDAGVAAHVRKEQRGDGARRDCSVTDRAVRRCSRRMLAIRPNRPHHGYPDP
jgi:hypothetical protein